MNTIELDQSTPHGLMRCFADRLNAADLDGLVALYEPSAAFEPQPGEIVRGRTVIREALDELLAINDWSLTGTAPDGTPVRQHGRSTDVVRRQPDGRWLVLIDKP